MKKEIPEREVNDAIRTLEADYAHDVFSMAKNFAERMKSGDITDDFSDALHEVVDGCQRVIYTQQAQAGLMCSKNSDAYLEQGFEADSLIKDGAINWPLMMYCALEADIIEELDRYGVNVNDPDSWSEIDLKEFE
jgi:hypothetical protein